MTSFQKVPNPEPQYSYAKFPPSPPYLQWDPYPQYVLDTDFASGIGSTIGNTVDTGQPYRLILFSDGTVKAIPSNTPDPLAPTALDATERVASVTLTWSASLTSGVTYAVFRDNVQIGTTSALTYRDGTVATGSTYSYKVRAVDVYGQASAFTAPVTSFVDPALNVAPTATVTAWPPAYFTDGKTLIRVCGADADAQSLLFALGVNSGFVQATDDPTVWYYTPA